eukprot:763187-Hanusia_phi.AAC.1
MSHEGTGVKNAARVHFMPESRHLLAAGRFPSSPRGTYRAVPYPGVPARRCDRTHWAEVPGRGGPAAAARQLTTVEP